MARITETGGSVPSLPRGSQLPDLISNAFRSPVGQGIFAGLQGLQNIAFDIPEGLLGLGLQKAASALPGAGRGREEQAVTDAVSSELEKLPAAVRPFAAPLLYAAGAGEAKRIAQQRANLPSVEIGPAKFDLLDIAEGGLPIGGIAQGAVKAARTAKVATTTPKGLLATDFDALITSGKTEAQAADEVARKYGSARAQRFFETGEDVAAATSHIGGAAPAATAAGRAARVTATETADAIEELARASKRRDLIDLPPDQRVLASKAADPVVSATRSGTEQGRRLGVNPEKIEGLDKEVQDVILDTANRNAGFIAQRRGTLSISEITGELSAKTGLTAERILSGRVGQAYNAEELWTLNRTMADSATRVSELRQLVNTAAGNSDANKTKLIAAMVEQAALQQVFSGARTEAGRALRVMREVLDQGDALPSAYDRAYAAVGGRANADKLIDRLNAIWTDPKYSDADKLDWTYAFTRQLGKSSRLDKANELWVNSILSGLRTQEINFISNVAFALVQPAVRFLAAGIEAAVTAGGKTRPREIFFGDAAYGAFGLVRGVGPGLRKAVYRLRNGFEAGEATKFRETGQLGRPQAIGGKVGTVVNAPLRLLAATDDLFKTIGYQSELYAQAARAAGREGLPFAAPEWSKRVAELIANPTDDMLTKAGDFADYVTFTSRTGALTSGLIKMRDQFPAMRFVIPFIQTPTNLLKRGAEFSPLGLVSAAKSGGAERSIALARTTIGSGIAAYFATLLLDGRMTGSAPRSEAERDAFYRSGKIPYALKIGDSWVEFRRIEPLATELTWMAAAYDAWQQDPGADLTETAGRVAASVGRGILDATYLDGIADFIDAIEDPQRYGGDWLSRLASGFVPFSSLTRSVAQAQDPIIRKPESLGEQIAANLPGLSQTVPPRLDAFGRPIERPGSRQGIGAVVNPLLISRERQDRVEAELSQLSVPSGVDSQGRRLPPKPVLIGFTGEEIAGMGLSSEEARRYQELAGQATYQALEQIVSDPKYPRMSAAEKVEAVTKAKNDARRAARSALALEISDKAVTPEMLARAAQMGFAAATTNIGKASFLAQLRKQSKLTADVVKEIERGLDPDELTVRDYLRGKELADAWNKAPAFVVGTRQAWEAAERARDQYAALIKDKSATERQRDAAVQRFYSSAAGGWLRLLYEADGSRRTKYVHPTRRAIEQDVLWERFAPKRPETPKARTPRPAPAIVAAGR